MAFSYRNHQCREQFPITKAALLNLIKPDVLLEEEQVLRISSLNGYPDGGSFTLWIDSDNYTNPITYYASGYTHTATLIRRALLPYYNVTVSASSAILFKIKFDEEDAGNNIKELRVKDNDLTLDGSPAGSIQITTNQEGYAEPSLYRLLKSIPESNWNITSFDPDTRTACVDVTNSGVTSHFSVNYTLKTRKN